MARCEMLGMLFKERSSIAHALGPEGQKISQVGQDGKADGAGRAGEVGKACAFWTAFAAVSESAHKHCTRAWTPTVGLKPTTTRLRAGALDH